MNDADFYLPSDWSVWERSPETFIKNSFDVSLDWLPSDTVGIIYTYWRGAPLEDRPRPSEWDRDPSLEVPLKFWFNRDTRLAIPIFALGEVKYGDTDIVFIPPKWPVELLFRSVRFEVNGNPLDEYKVDPIMLCVTGSGYNGRSFTHSPISHIDHYELPNAPGGPQPDQKLVVVPPQIRLHSRSDILRERRSGIQRCYCGSYNVAIVTHQKRAQQDGGKICTCDTCGQKWRG